jgi:hypothetical protein
MSLARKDRIELELDGFVCKWQTSSDIGTQIAQGQSGRDPKSGKLIKTAGQSDNRPLSLSKVYDPSADAAFVTMLLDESPTATLRSGKTKATLVYYNDLGSVEAKYVLGGLTKSSYAIPGIDFVGKGFAMLSVEFEYESIKAQ